MKTNIRLKLLILVTLLLLAVNVLAQSVTVPTVNVIKGKTAQVALAYVAGGNTTNFDFTMTYDESVVNEDAIVFACDPAVVGLTTLTCAVDKANNQVKGIGTNLSAGELVSGAFAEIDLPVFSNASTGNSVEPFSENFATDNSVTPVDTTWTLKVSAKATFKVNNELRNIATRADVQTGANIAIAGFIITGKSQKCVIVRGRGPSVGVPAGAIRLPDPTLTLKSGTTTIAENDNWTQQDNPDHVAIIEDLGKAPGDLLDAAIYICLDPGPYTVLVKGYLGTTGIGIVEVLDVDNSAPYLRNIATRARVGTAHSVTIAGFIIAGDAPKQILIRGRGPSVGAPAGVTRLPDPTLTLKSGQTTIGSNDNWQDADNVADIIDTGRAPDDPKDSAILTELQPGAYTVILRGSGNVTGLGIIEVLDLTGRK